MNSRTHVSFHVADLERSIAFYEALFGVPATKRRADYANFRLETPALHLSLIPGEPAVAGMGREASHFGVELFDLETLGAWRQRVERAGMQTEIEDDVVCCYARADKVWVSDPDGRPWELWVRSAEADAMSEAPKEAACCAPSAERAAEPSCCAPQGEAAPVPEPSCCG